MPEHESYEAFIERMAGACPPPGFIDTGFTVYDVPVDPDDPRCSSFVGRRVYRNDAGPMEQPAGWHGPASPHPDDWPMPKPPPYPADDEGKASPDA